MKEPQNIALPFFAYGVFKPGQLSFLQIREFVKEFRDTVSIPGALRLRDGFPLLDREDHQQHVKGSLIMEIIPLTKGNG